MRPLTVTPSTGSLKSRKAGRSDGGSWNDNPSSPPVMPESCEASTSPAEATARVIIEKKIALTRSERSPMTAASNAERASAASSPIPTELQVGPSRSSAMATP